MIDYEKLKRAHELCRGLVGYHFDVEFGRKARWFELYAPIAEESPLLLETGDIDELIATLEEFTKPEPQFKIGDTVWILSMVTGKITKAKVESHPSTIDKRGTSYFLGEPVYASIFESSIHPNREALIQHQIEYWQSMLEPKASCCSVHAGGNEECARHDNGCIDLIAHGMALREKVEECAREDDTHTKPEECEHEEDGSYTQI